MVLSAGWWVAIVELVPASARPYIGGSQTNSFLELTFGYNGLGRLSGDETGSVGGGGGGGWRHVGRDRADPDVLLEHRRPDLVAHPERAHPARGRPLAARPSPAHRPAPRGLPRLGRLAPRHDARLLASWPASSTSTTPWPSPRRSVPLVGMGAVEAWERRSSARRRRSPSPPPPRPPRRGASSSCRARRPTATGCASRCSPSAWPPPCSSSRPAGCTPRAVPARPRRRARRRPRRPGGVRRVDHRPGPHRLHRDGRPRRVEPRSRRRAASVAARRRSCRPAGPTGRRRARRAPAGRRRRGHGRSARRLDPEHRGRRGPVGERRPATRGSPRRSARRPRPVSSSARSCPVMAIGGFNGSDPSPTLAQFQQYVANGQIHYFASGGRGFGNQNGGSSASSEISSWVQENFTPVTIDGSTFYDLTQPAPVTHDRDSTRLHVAAANPPVAAGRPLRRRGHRVHRPAPRPLRGPGAGRCRRPSWPTASPSSSRRSSTPALNRAWTFGVSGRRRLVSQHGQALVIFAITYAATTVALAVLGALVPDAGTPCRPLVVAVANVLSTAARFVAMRRWIFREPAERRAALTDRGPPRPGIRDRRRAREPARRPLTAVRRPA